MPKTPTAAPAELRTCALEGCDATFAVKRGGRPREFCSDAHRAEAHRRRRSQGPDPLEILRSAMDALEAHRQPDPAQAEDRARLAQSLAAAEARGAELAAALSAALTDADTLGQQNAQLAADVEILTDQLATEARRYDEAFVAAAAERDAAEARAEARYQELAARHDASIEAHAGERAAWLGREAEHEALVATLRYEAGETAGERDAATSRAEAAEAEVEKLRGELVASVEERNRLAVALGRAEEAVAARDDALVTMRAERDEARMEVEKLRGQVQWLEGTVAQRHAEAAAAYALATERGARVEALDAERDDALVAALRRIEAGVARLGRGK